MKSITVLLLPVLALTSYAANTKVTANFDDLKAPAIQLAAGASPGTYKSITYNALELFNSSLSLVGVLPHSSPNALVTGSVIQATNGTASLTVAKPYTSFGLTDFWFGCIVRSGESNAEVAVQCTVTVAGFDGTSEKEVALASFTFTPPDAGVGSIPMIHAVLPSTFLNSNVRNVTLIETDTAVDALLVDSFSYYLYK